MAIVSSNLHSLGDIEGFIRDMRKFGAVRVQVGGVSVDFGHMPTSEVPEAPKVELTPEEIKHQTELLLFGSSD